MEELRLRVHVGDDDDCSLQEASLAAWVLPLGEDCIAEAESVFGSRVQRQLGRVPQPEGVLERALALLERVRVGKGETLQVLDLPGVHHLLCRRVAVLEDGADFDVKLKDGGDLEPGVLLPGLGGCGVVRRELLPSLLVIIHYSN